jgi:hypothetical protein
MKKIILVMVALIAAPAMAEVTISVVNNADCTFDITYAATDADQLNGKSLISGMALNISVDGGATIDSISGYKTDGESTNGSPGYGIYPASITITSGVFVSSGDPVADAGDPGTVGVLGDSAITIELGALYDDDAVPSAAPLATGTLCTLTLGNAGSSHNVTLALEETHRKGVIMEDGSSRSVGSGCTLVGAEVTCGEPYPECWMDTEGDTQCHGDFAGSGGSGPDGTVNSTDFLTLKAAYGSNYGEAEYNPCADASRDGAVNSTDFLTMKSYYGDSPVAGGCENSGGTTWPPL